MLVIAFAFFMLSIECIHAAPLVVNITRIEADECPVITCYLSVLDRDGKSLSGLETTQFTIKEENLPVKEMQCVSTLPGNEKIAAILILDHSGSMRGAPLVAAKNAAIDFTQHLSLNDKLAVIAFGNKVDVATELSTKSVSVENTIRSIQPSGETALYDAIHKAVMTIAGCTADRKAIIVLTDGQDTASTATAAQCATAANKHNVNIFGVGLGRSINSQTLKLLAETTGGRCFLTNAPGELISIYRTIAQQLQYQYKLTYHSPLSQKANVWRTVSISVNDVSGDGSGQRQYLAPSTGVKPSAIIAPKPNIIWGMAAFVLLDVVLFVILLRRRRMTIKRES